MADIRIDTLRGFTLPASVPYRRDPVVPEAFQTDKYRQDYDDRTLFYDCCTLDQSGQILLTAPPLSGLWPLVRRALRIDGKPVGWMRQRRSGRSAQVLLRARAGASVGLEIDGQTYPLAPRPSLASMFSGLNCAVTVNKNNDLNWIRDWVRYHISAHGLEGVVIFDNGSTAYDPSAIAEVLDPLPGLKSAAILSAPYHWGGNVDGPTGMVRYKFLQTALINLARRSEVSQARAVIGMDIDELVLGPNGASVFDAAESRWLSYVKLGGQWVFPEAANGAPTGQSDHVYRPEPARPCKPKWCARPDSLLSRLGWNVHNVGAEQGRRVKADRQFSLIHCSACSTGWKPASRRYSPPAAVVQDPALVRLMARHLPKLADDA
ncbi:hypothetical protein [Pseudoruegeria sp. SK021]|uniref:hypothetical protein n=1 Tax=Pseudoruegeria sp. SK021 TaxID=1933035 RepID=UPI000A23F8ED|nr:hypothetical protein [Pseudoruegeria sp. SK021]OSP55563.1 hypothetical protein BV911_06760 [Pseudoruegeria sp. SK021]